MDESSEKPSDLDRERAELGQRAYRVMESSFEPVPAHLIPGFRLWHYPPAGPHLSWTVFQRRQDDPIHATPIVRRILWDRDADFERLELRARRRSRIDPTLQVAEHELDPIQLAILVEKASGLNLAPSHLRRPYVADQRRMYGLDGFDVEGRDGRPIVRLEWDQASGSLKGIAAWAAEVRPWLERACR